MVRASVAKAIDFHTADLTDYKWWLKLRWVLNRLEDENTIDVFRLQHAQHASVLSYDLSKETFDSHWDAANTIIKNVFALYFPWAEESKKDAQKKTHYDLIQVWKERYGDINDPAVKEKYDKLAEKVSRMHANQKANPRKSKFQRQNEMLQKVVTNRKQKKRKP